jgi:hypothetical protein
MGGRADGRKEATRTSEEERQKGKSKEGRKCIR